MNATGISVATVIIVTVVAAIALRVIYRKGTITLPDAVKRKKSSDVMIMIGLVLSSVLDPAAKNRIEALDSQRKRKVEPGRENE